MSAIQIDQKLMHYEALGRRGAGGSSPLIFIHGWLGSWRYWVPTMEELSSHYRTYALDLWGYGDSDKSRSSYDMQDFVKLLELFIGELGVRRVALIGHSLGGVLAIRLANQRSDLVSKLVTVSLPIVGSSFRGPDLNRFLRSREPQDGKMNRLCKSVIGNRNVASQEILLKEADKVSNEAILRSVEALSQLDLQEEINRLSGLSDPLPLLAIYGGEDNIVNPSEADFLDHRTPSIKSIIMEGARHFPMLDDASKFNRLLRNFLKLGEDLQNLQVKEEWRRRTGM
jgi:pimeloyl-ACP methyl ester carboxylesterase